MRVRSVELRKFKRFHHFKIELPESAKLEEFRFNRVIENDVIVPRNYQRSPQGTLKAAWSKGKKEAK